MSFGKLGEFIKNAREAGASDKDLAEIRRQFLMMSDFHPTKKTYTKEQRRRKRLTQKASRKHNRGKTKGIKCHKGQKYRMK